MGHRVQFLLRFLEEHEINVRVVDISFHKDPQSFFGFFKKLLFFCSNVSASSSSIINFPSLPVLSNDRGYFNLFTHFVHPFLEFALTRIVSRHMEYNVIVATDPISAFIAGAARKSKTIFVYEDLDYFEDLQPGRIRSKFISLLERIGLVRADLVISVSEPLLRRANLFNLNCILVPNGADLKCFPGPQDTRRESLIVYAGSLVEWAGLELAIKGFPLLKEKIPGVKMKIIGEGEGRTALEELVNILSLQDSISFTGKLPYRQMASLLSKSCIGLALFKPGNAAFFASPLKLFDYMAAGVPVIGTDIGDIGRILRDSRSGYAIKWAVPEFVKAAERLLTNQNEWLDIHENGLRYVEKYDWDRLFDGWLLEVMNRLKRQSLS
jgi:glycosyltransferase involved in cell wall biosynthesis